MIQDSSLDPALLWARDKYLGLGFASNSRELLKRELRRTLFCIVNDLLEETDQEIPFKPELLGPKRRVKKIFEADLSKVNALLLPEIGGFVMKIKSDLHPFQKRFACAHEIGHTFFFNIDTDPPRREFQSDKSAYWVEEEFSCAIAREILLPSTSIRETVQKDVLLPSIGAIRYLSNIYQVSYDVIRLKVINDIPLWDCIIFRSVFSDGKFVTLNVSKGMSYRKVRIPRIIENDSTNSELFSFLSSTLRRKRLKDRISTRGIEYSIETTLLAYGEPVLMSILTNRSSEL